MKGAMREELGKRKARAVEAAAKMKAAEKLAKAYGRVMRAAQREHDGLYDLYLAGEDEPPAAQAVLFDDDPTTGDVEDALAELLGEGYRTPAAIAADQVDEMQAAGWESTPIADVGVLVYVAVAMADEIDGYGAIHTLGDLAREARQAGGIGAALAYLKPEEIGDVVAAIRRHSADHPGFPAEMLDAWQAAVEEACRREQEEESAAMDAEPTSVKDDAPAWDVVWHHTTPIVLPHGADYIHSKYTPGPAVNAGYRRDRIEFNGPSASPTGHRSHYFDRPTGPEADDPRAWVDRLARHVARVVGRAEAAEAEGAPAWRSRPVADLVELAGLAKSRVGPLKKGGLRTIGDVADAMDLDFYVGFEHVSDPGYRDVASAFELARASLERPAAEDWADTPLGMVVIRGDLVAALKAGGLTTLGGLADACELSGSLALALDDMTPIDVDLVERDVRTWSSKRPGFPLDRLQLPDDARAEPTADVLEELRAALWPDGQNPPWKLLRDHGASDAEIRGVLAEIWPESPEFVEPDEPGEHWGYTVRGGERPAFWLGDAKPNASAMVLPATLIADGLIAAVRKELRIRTPEQLDDVAAEKAPKKPAKKARPTSADARA